MAHRPATEAAVVTALSFLVAGAIWYPPLLG